MSVNLSFHHHNISSHFYVLLVLLRVVYIVNHSIDGYLRLLESVFCVVPYYSSPVIGMSTREANTDKAIAIAVRGMVQEPDVAGVSSEYNFDESAIKALTA